MRCSIPRAAWCSARPTTVCRCRWPCSIGCSSPEVSEKSLMIMHRSDQALAIRALRSAAPYIRMYKGKTFVVKAGGGVFADPPATRVLVEQIAILHHFGVRVVLVHGGGPQLTELSAALGVPTRMVDGRRVTDQRSIDVTAMVLNGLINTRVLGMCRDLSIEAVGISGVDAGLVRRVHVVSYQSPEGILGEVFTNEGTGTLIVADVNALTPAEQQSTP